MYIGMKVSAIVNLLIGEYVSFDLKNPMTDTPLGRKVNRFGISQLLQIILYYLLCLSYM